MNQGSPESKARKTGVKRLRRLLGVSLLLSFSLTPLLHSASTSWAGPRAILEGIYPLSSLQVLGECVNRLKERYFDPERIRPREMVAKTIESLQNHVIPLLVDREEGDETMGPKAIIIRMGDEERRFELDEVTDLDRMVWTLMNALQFIDAHLPPGADREELETIATNAMLHTLDPHTTFLDPGSYRDMQVETSGLFGGLGIVISLVKGELTIISVMEETPAFKAGLHPRDKVVQIGDESTVNMELSEAVSRMRGKPGTALTIQVLRKGWTERRPYSITRARITIRSVVSKLLDGGIGYIRLKNFRANTSDQLRIHLAKLRGEAKKPIAGVILDLRDDPGGFLEQAIRVADQFLKKGEIVRTIGAGNKIRDNRSARPHNDTKGTSYEDTSLIVLINPGSASASEIVAGALKNHNRAILIGNRSFGKGTVQGIYELGDGAVKITIAEYLTPGGVPVHEVGVIPDIAIQGINTDLENMMIFSHKHLAHDGPPSAPTGSARYKAQQATPRHTMRFVMEGIEDNEEARDRRRFEYDVVDEKDFAIDLAAQILRASPHGTADVMFRKAANVLKKVEKRETKRLEKAMRAHSVDWSGGPRVDRPRLSATVTTDPSSGEIEAGEELKITVRLRNTGPKTLFRIHGIASSSTRLLEGREFLFGRIEPGAEKQWTAAIKPHLSSYERFDPMKIEFYQDNDAIGLHREFLVGVRTSTRPSFEFTYHLDDEKGGNGDGRVQVGERVSLNISVRNRGDGATAETTAALKNSAGEGIFLERGRRTVEEPIKPGDIQGFSFTFDVRPSLTTSRIPFELQLRDRKNGIAFRERFSLPVHSSPTEETRDEKGPCMAKKALVLLGGASNRFPAVAQVQARTALKTLRTSGKWMMVRAPNGLSGWVRSSELVLGTHNNSLAQPVKALMAFNPPSIKVTSPLGRGLFTKNHEVNLLGEIVFYRAGRALERSVTIFVEGRKVWFATRRHIDEDLITIPMNIPIELKEGQNRVSIRAQEGDRVDIYKTIFIHRGKLEVSP